MIELSNQDLNTIIFCHSLYEKSNEMYELLNNHQVYDMKSEYKNINTSSAMSLDDFKNTKSTLRKNTILSMNRRQREHTIKQHMCFKSLRTFKR